MENKVQKDYRNNYISNKNQQENNQNNYSQYRNIYFYEEKQNNKNNIENPKVITNKIIPSNNALYSSYQQNNKIIKNNTTNLSIKNNNVNQEKILYQNNENENNNSFFNQNEDLAISVQLPSKAYQFESNYQNNPNKLKEDLSISVQKPYQNYQISNNQLYLQQQQNSFEDLSFISQKPFQPYENNINVVKNDNRYSNIVNIDNQYSAIELSFVSKKPKKKCKTSTIFQVGLNQTPIGFSFLAEKPNKYMNNNNLNESNGQNLSFMSSRQIDSNDLKNEEFLSVSKPKNNLKIMTNSQLKKGKNNNSNQSKPKPVLQIVSRNNTSNKKLQDNFLPQPQINGFSINSKKKDSNEIVKNNSLYIIKGANETFNNNNQDLSFISNSKETENLLEINGININDYKIGGSSGNMSLPNDKPIFSINNGLSSSQQSANNNKYSNYIMLNSQFYYLSEKPKSFDAYNYYEYSNKNHNCSLAKKRIKIEYYDIQPVSFQIIPLHIEEENLKKSYEMELKKIYAKKEFKNCIAERVYQMQFRPYKMFRVVQIEYIKNDEEKKEEKKELEQEPQKDEDVSEKSFNKGNKKRKRRRKK